MKSKSLESNVTADSDTYFHDGTKKKKKKRIKLKNVAKGVHGLSEGKKKKKKKKRKDNDSPRLK